MCEYVSRFVWLTQAIGLHDDHDHGGHDDHHANRTVRVEPHVWKMLCATLTVWLFFVVQIILQWIGKTFRQRRKVNIEVSSVVYL